MQLMARRLPSGRVTFAFTDVVGSTRTFAEYGDAYVAAVRAMHALIAEHAARVGGVVVSTEGDGAMLAFPTAAGAVEALTSIMAAMEAPSGEGLQLRIRAGAHTGDAVPIGDEYVAMAVYVAARVSAMANAGQLVVAQSVIDEMGGPRARRVGQYSLKDVTEPVTVWQLTGDDAPLRATPARRTNVPDMHTSFVGREVELEQLRALLSTPGCVTLCSTGGCGKTRLVSEFALANASTVPGGVWLVELAPLEPGAGTARLWESVAAALGMTSSNDQTRLTAELRRRGHVVLVLDNCEHVLDAAADLVAEVTAACPELRVLATSREDLEVGGERVLRLATLATASVSSEVPGCTTPGAAEDLFIERAEAVGGSIPGDQLPLVSEICKLLDGLPLALELAAARAGSMPLEAMLDALNAGDFPLRRRGGQARQRSLEALVWWSLRLLSEAERDALFVLAVFPARFAPSTAREVLGGVDGLPQDAGLELARRGLLDLDGDSFRMLATIRGVARKELAARPTLEKSGMQALLRWAVRLAEVSDRSALTVDEVLSFEVALDWALTNAVQGVGELVQSLQVWGLSHRMSQRARSLAERVMLGPPPRTSDELRSHLAARRLLHGLGGADVDADDVRALVQVAREMGDQDLYLRSLTLAAIVLDHAGRFEESLPFHQEAIDQASDVYSVGMAQHDLGVRHHLLGEFDQAEALYRAALTATASENPPNALALMTNLGELMLDAGRIEAAASHLRAAVRKAEGNYSLRMYALALLIEAQCRLGNADLARALAAQSESDLNTLVADDPSLTDMMERMRAALETLPDAEAIASASTA